MTDTSLAIYDRRRLRLDLIIRTSKRKKEAKSPQQQIDIAQACATAHEHEIVYVHDSGTDESGKTMNRATLNAARERRRAGLTDGIIVALADRLGRAPIEEAMAVVREWYTEGSLVLADMGGQPIDLSNGVNETNVVMQLQFARQYWLTTANRCKRSVLDAIAAGKWIGRAPLGYEKIREGAEKGKLREHPRYGTIMRRVIVIAARDGLGPAVAYMQRMVPERTWDANELRRVLKSKVYLGEIHYGSYPPNLDAGHPKLCTRTDWTAAQTEAHARRSNGDYPLSNLVHCVECDGGLTGWLQTVPSMMRDPENWKRFIADPSKPKRSYRRMRCGSCYRTAVSADQLEAHVREVLEALLADQDYRDQFAPEGLEAAAEALRAAEDNSAALVEKMPPSHPKFSEWLERYDAELIAARDRYYELAAMADWSNSLPLASELHKPEQFERALRAVTRFDRIVVTAGRGPIADRVSVRRHAGDDVTGPLAA